MSAGDIDVQAAVIEALRSVTGDPDQEIPLDTELGELLASSMTALAFSIQLESLVDAEIPIDDWLTEHGTRWKAMSVADLIAFVRASL